MKRFSINVSDRGAARPNCSSNEKAKRAKSTHRPKQKGNFLRKSYYVLIEVQLYGFKWTRKQFIIFISCKQILETTILQIYRG